MKILLYDHWKFHLAENAKPDFTKLDTYEWRAVQLPHDWSTDYPFDENANTSGSGGYARAGIGWYWRSFEVKKEDNERVLLYFEGIYMNSSVYVNGSLAGGHVYGYTPFELDVTELVKEGSNEVLIVVDNSLQPGSRWYSGSGITRDVWMETRNTLHIARYGTYCVTELEQEKASLQVSVTIHDENISCKDSVKLIVTLYAPDGTKVAESEAFATKEWKAGDLEALVMNGKDSKEVPRLWTNTINTELLVENPVLWTVDNPALYQLTVSLYEGETCLETRTQVVGIRSAAFDNKKGFLLNGEQVKLNGVCLHHDGGCVGAAVPKAIWERRLKKLKNKLKK